MIPYNTIVRINDEVDGSINEFAQVGSPHPLDDGRYWVTNLYQPFQGNISKYMTPTEFEVII